MPRRETVEAFVAMVEAGHFVEAMERFYAPDASAQENLGEPRRGREALIAHERRTLAANPEARAERLSPVFIEGDRVVIHWRFFFRSHAGDVTVLEELALQSWDGEMMRQEQFFYDPAQLRRR